MTPTQRDDAHADAVAATVAHIRGVLTTLDTVEYGETPPAFSFTARNGTPDAHS